MLSLIYIYKNDYINSLTLQNTDFTFNKISENGVLCMIDKLSFDNITNKYVKYVVSNNSSRMHDVTETDEVHEEVRKLNIKL